ncbi:murein hydrolase activator EnvC family protein [Kineococcus arenarius]|uniref:murein hydrolase activator EnvC family protein n=1 Tax=unclassified Kineococcus TaxID=2621656 RepID=UPI003D7E560C
MPPSTAATAVLTAAAAAALLAASSSAGPAADPARPPGAVGSAASATTPPPASAPAPAPAPGAGTRWSWPLHPRPVVLRGFDDVTRYAPGHRGIDLAAEPGQQVLSPAPATVAFSGPVAGRGVVVLEHAGGLRTSYEPVLAGVPVGTRLDAGEAFAALGAGAHCADAPCLHLGLRRGEDYLDPLTLLAPAGPPVLLPLGRAG